jgi:hypothetical protein
MKPSTGDNSSFYQSMGYAKRRGGSKGQHLASNSRGFEVERKSVITELASLKKVQH